MQALRRLYWVIWLLPLLGSGCVESNAPGSKAKAPQMNEAAPVVEKPKAAEEAGETDQIKANLAKLSPEDRKLAEAQKVCVESDEPLGGMGVPVKIMVKDQPVFLCCNSCKSGALKDPDKTLAKLEKIQSDNKKAIK